MAEPNPFVPKAVENAIKLDEAAKSELQKVGMMDDKGKLNSL